MEFNGHEKQGLEGLFGQVKEGSKRKAENGLGEVPGKA